MFRIHVLAAAIAANLIGSAVAAERPRSGEEQLALALRGRTAGRPVNCIQLKRVGDSSIVDKTAIIFAVGDVLYVNKPASGGDALSDSKVLLLRMSASQLCSGQAVHLFDPGAKITVGFELLGPFVPYRRIAPNRMSAPNLPSQTRRGPSGY
jgi:hypothetical protein